MSCMCGDSQCPSCGLAQGTLEQSIFEVIVGNVGTVYVGNNYMKASSKFQTYIKQSKNKIGRAGGEPVVLMHKGSIRHEYEPPKDLCPICGQSIKITGTTTTGRLIGSCGDAFSVDQWETE